MIIDVLHIACREMINDVSFDFLKNISSSSCSTYSTLCTRAIVDSITKGVLFTQLSYVQYLATFYS